MPQQPRGGEHRKRRELTAAEHAILDWTHAMVGILDNVQSAVRDAPAAAVLPRETIHRLCRVIYLMTLDVIPGWENIEEHRRRAEIKHALWEALTPIGLGVADAEQIVAWTIRDRRDRGDLDIVINE